MVKLTLAAICERAIVDERTKLASLIDIIENLSISVNDDTEEGKDWVNVAGQFTLAMFYIRSDFGTPEECTCRLSVISPSEKVYKTRLEFKVNLNDSDRTRVFMKLPSLPFFESGLYWFTLEAFEEDEWVELGRIPILMEQSKTSAK